MEGTLTRWAERIRCWSAGAEPSGARRIVDEPAPPRPSRDVYCYFDNTDKVEAPDNARRLMQKLDVSWPPGDRPAERRIDRKKISSTASR